MSKFNVIIAIIKTKLLYRVQTEGFHSYIIRPIKIMYPEGITLRHNVVVHDFSWLYGASKQTAKGLVINDGTRIGHFAHIVAIENVEIEKNVLLADKVFISDCTHSYENMDNPILNQDVKLLKPVTIGEGSWLGENVCVCGASIGKHCVIAANSVVTKDIPDYCVAAGSPAKVVKKYNFDTNMWEKV